MVNSGGRDGELGPDQVVKTVHSTVFALVSAASLLELRPRIEGSRVPFHRVTAPVVGGWAVAPATWESVAAAHEMGSSAEFVLPRQWLASAAEASGAPESGPKPDAFLKRWNDLLELSPEARIEELQRTRHEFEQKALAGLSPADQVREVRSVTELVFLVNRASMSLNKAGPSALDQVLVEETLAVVRSVVSLLEESTLASSLFESFQSLSSGQTFDHILRVFATTVGFLLYYGQQHRSGLNQKLRAVFSAEYRAEYRALVPGVPDHLLTSDHLLRLPSLTADRVRVFALGSLLHDLGKILDLDYFEQDPAYDLDKIRRHPLLGAGLFHRTYGPKYDEARVIIGDHHNYLGHPDGYGVTRWDKSRSPRRSAEPRCSVADSLDDFLSGQSLGFLPVEICAIVDVFDALVDPSRRYKSPRGTAEALEFMDQAFRSVKKIDPFLFDLFADYLRSLGVDVPSRLGFAARYDRRRA